MKKFIFALLLIGSLFAQTRTVNAHLLVKGDISMEGNADDAFEGTFTLPSVTADRTWTLPDADLTFGSLLTDPMTTRGDIIYRNSSNVTARLGIGTNLYVLQSDGTDLAWSEFLASEMNIVDGGSKITATEVEGALQENRIAIDLNTSKVTMTYPGAGIALSTGSAWSSSITNNSANWNTAYTDRLKWDGGATDLVASTGRTSLGGTTIGQNIFIKTNPGAITFGRANADNTFDWLSATNFRTAIGVDVAGTDNSTDVTLNASATTGGLGLSTQEITYRAATNAQTGYMTAALVTNIETNNAKNTNVSTTLSTGTVNATTYSITSDGGADDVTLVEATTTTSGLLGAAKWDEIVANTVHKGSSGTDHSLLGATPGTATASIALIVDANKDITLDGGDLTAVLGNFTGNVESNSLNVIEGYGSGRLILRKSQIEISPGDTPNTNINVNVNNAARDFNQPTMTDATNLIATGSSGSFSLNAGNTLTLDISENIITVLGWFFYVQDMNSSGTITYYVDAQISGANIILIPYITGNSTGQSWLDIIDAGDTAAFVILYLTST
ncbi:hypothetical protein LCGC14_0364810 [marine sediment metagenome]|uniref:Uncharacterized protein n=1 Tax=marine sediment metagenome TaxID=412755 RepID=A0A0F9TCR5_9ZZZZ